MPLELHDFVHAVEHADDGIAGYVEPGERPRFPYWRSSNPMLPAFVNCLEDGGDMRRVYTNHDQAPWARPRGPGVKRRANLRPGEGDGGLLVEPVPMTSRRWPVRVVGHGGPAPLAGGLHAALSGSRTTPDSPDSSVGTVSTRTLHRYLLAARTLIASSADSGFAGSHDHVGAILVSDAGEILAAGINSGSYRHAEVSLLLAWFRDHPEARALPPRSVVLSTLTPCRQCTRYLSLAKAPDTLIRFDEADAGRAGRAGERIAERLDGAIGHASTFDPPTGGPVPDRVGATSAHGPMPPGTDAVHRLREAERRAIRNGRRGEEGGSSRIERSLEARRLLLGGVAGRAASSGDAGDEAGRRTEAAVSAYLAEWVAGARLVA